MCGIIGILGKTAVADHLVDALRRLEYRGYDSAGVATLDENGELVRRRAEGKLKNLEARLREEPLLGTSGIGHTRWATHGRPTEQNAHPHASAEVAVVHNGIIENFRELREELSRLGHTFSTETDTETVVHLITEEMRSTGGDPVEGVRLALKKLRGAFALAILFKGRDDLMIAARQGSPLAIGHGDGEVFIGSDAIALAPFTSDITYLEEGDWAVLSRNSMQVHDHHDQPVTRAMTKVLAGAALVDKGNHRHFMAKEMHEQPEVISHTLAHYINMAENRVDLPELGVDVASLSRITITACGTAYYAGLVAKYMIEHYARIPVEIDVASEMRYREPPLPENGLALFISQSGETADTLATLRYCKGHGQRIAAVVNVPTSTIAREADVVLPTLAGPEIGVASTKAFTCQLSALSAFAIGVARARGTISRETERELVKALLEVPRHITGLLVEEALYERLAHDLSKASDVLYLGRGVSFPLAMEGALKLKEISYLHAEGYAAGELKHGPIALIDEDVPVIVVAPEDGLFEKTISNVQEVAARGGKVILLTDADDEAIGCDVLARVSMPKVHPFITPLIYSVPIQLIAYHTAVLMGTDVDQPRNLAKSVTVE